MNEERPPFKATLPEAVCIFAIFLTWALIIGLVDGDESLSGKAVGAYNTLNQKIWVDTDDMSPGYVISVCAHEAGHYVWYEYLDDDARDNYQTIYNASDFFISDYAFIGGATEDFAESYSEAVICRFEPSRVPTDRQGFFRQSVMWTWGTILKAED